MRDKCWKEARSSKLEAGGIVIERCQHRKGCPVGREGQDEELWPESDTAKRFILQKDFADEILQAFTKEMESLTLKCLEKSASSASSASL